MRLLAACTIGFALAVTSTLAAPQTAPAQKASDNPITASMRVHYEMNKVYFTKSAEMMPEKDYTFHPATMPSPDKKEIRTFGQLIGHVASEQYLYCAVASGVQPPAGTPTIEATKTTKADLQKALADSFTYCDRVWASTTDLNASTANEMPFGMGRSTRLGALVFNTTHVSEHYGNLATYLRAKGMVPPSSQPSK